jgi:phage terminase large subunit-like protein
MATQKQRDLKKADAYRKKLEVSKAANAVTPFESREEQQERILRARTDVIYFVKTYLPHYATVESAPFHTEWAGMVIGNPTFKGFAQWGRGLAKSVWSDVILPLWLMINGEAHYLVLVSDSRDRAEDLLEDLRAELEGNALFVHDFGEQKQEGHWERGDFTTQNGFTAKAFGVRQKVRGLRTKSQRPDICICDDLETPDTLKNYRRMDAQARWIERDLIPTMTGRQRRLLYANNRFARVMTQTILQERHPSWTVHHVRAYDKTTYEPAWKAMYDAGFYRAQESPDGIGLEAALAEYNHECRLKGKIFSEEQIQWCEPPAPTEFKMIVVHWDIAYAGNENSDYNAIKAWGILDRKFYLIDCYVKQSKMLPAVAWMCDFKKALPREANCIFQYESQFWNGEVQRSIDDAENAHGVPLNLMKVNCPKTDKLGRMISMQPYYQNSRIFYSQKLKSHNDTQVAIMQLCAVEEGSTEHDDSPDADRQALSALDSYDTPTRRSDGGKSWKTGRMKQTYSW